jgi:gamma-glutamylcyclotransferase (GGCT)/AIG2-like uncharacterized protein YtfP
LHYYNAGIFNYFMKNIFVYGTLMFEEVWDRIVHRHYAKQAAVLSGFRRLPVKGETYPGLVKSISGSVQGILYFDVNARDIKRLDKFEGKYYRKMPVRVWTMDGRVHNARTYVFSDRYRRLLGHSAWDPDHFHRQQLSGFITRYRGF